MDTKAMFKIGYGLYVLTAREDGKDNGCIVNTFQQVTGEPLRVSVCVNKANHTCGMIARTGVFNVSVIAESATFDLFKRFGFQSGATVDKFADFPCPRSPNGVLAVDRSVNAVVSGKVFQTVDLGTHLMFLADVTDAVVRSTEETATYAYYQRAIKPRPQPQVKRGWRCLICGYFYEGEELPADFVCPLCKHPASDFGLFCKIGHGIPCPICCMKQHSPSTTGCKHANDRPLWAFDGPGAVFTCSQPCAARFGSTRCEQAA